MSTVNGYVGTPKLHQLPTWPIGANRVKELRIEELPLMGFFSWCFKALSHYNISVMRPHFYQEWACTDEWMCVAVCVHASRRGWYFLNPWVWHITGVSLGKRNLHWRVREYEAEEFGRASIRSKYRDQSFGSAVYGLWADWKQRRSRSLGFLGIVLSIAVTTFSEVCLKIPISFSWKWIKWRTCLNMFCTTWPDVFEIICWKHFLIRVLFFLVSNSLICEPNMISDSFTNFNLLMA